MKILFISTLYPNTENPTRNIFVAEQAKALQKIGHEIRVIYANKLSSRKVLSKLNVDIRKETYDNIITYYRDCRTFKEHFFPRINRKWFCNTILKLFDCLQKEQWVPDIIYAHFSCWAGYSALKIGRKIDCPVVIIEHYSGFINQRCGLIMRKGVEKCANQAELTICVSEPLKNAIMKGTKIKKNIYVIPNMVNSIFQYVPFSNNKYFCFCSLGNLNKGKCFDVLINAFCKAFDVSDKVLLYIGGDGEEKEFLHKLIKNRGREKQIKLLGRLTRVQTFELYRTCHCFALPSAYETFGIVWREAMAVGRPIITTNHGGFDVNNWDQNIGEIIPINDENALINAMKKIYTDYNKYDGKYISQKCLSAYSENNIVRQLESLFYEVLR